MKDDECMLYTVYSIDRGERTVTFVGLDQGDGDIEPLPVRDFYDWPVTVGTFELVDALGEPIVNDPILRGSTP